MKEIGSTHAIINKIQTTVDGGARITLDIGAESSVLVSKLLSNKLKCNESVFVAFVEPVQEPEDSINFDSLD